jgi:hypothetical protein
MCVGKVVSDGRGGLSLRTSTEDARKSLPGLLVGDLHAAKVLIEIENDLERVAAASVRRCYVLLLHGGDDVGDTSVYLLTLLASRVREDTLKDLICGEGESELGRRSEDTRRTALEEGSETFFLPDSPGGVTESSVVGIALAGLDLESGLDHIARGGKVRSGHTSDGTGSEELHNTELLGLGLAEHILLEVEVCREVDRGEGNITKKACAGTFIETCQPKILNDEHSSGPGGRSRLRGLSSNLEADLHNFQRVREDLKEVSNGAQHQEMRGARL